MAYDNSARSARARATRARVIDAARESFLARGFSGTTIALVAEEAAVSPETIYKSFGNKAALLKAVYDVTLGGDDEDIPLAERPEAIAVREARTGAEAVATYAALAWMIGSRTDPIVRMIMGSRDTDAGLESFVETIHRERRVGSGMWIAHLQSKGWLRDDLDPDRAADILWAVNSYEPRWLLTDRGWSAEEFTAWLAETLGRLLLRPES